MSFQYFQSQQHYEYQYDLGTIKECLKQLEMINGIGEKLRVEPKFENYPESEHERNMGLFRGRMLFVTQALRYKNRASTIEGWMEADRIKQDKKDNTPVPKVNYPKCNNPMTDDGHHHLVDWDQFINEKELEIQKISKSYKYKIPKQIPDIRGRAMIFDEYLKKKKKLSERKSLEKYYVLYYKFFSQIAHLNSSGLNRFFVTDLNGQQRLMTDGSPDDVERIVSITYQIYFVLLRFFAKEYKLYKKEDFVQFEKFSKNMLKN